MHCWPPTKYLKTYIHSHFIIKISTNLIGTSKKHLLHTSMLSFPAEATPGELSCCAGQREQPSTTITQLEDDGVWMNHCRAAPGY